MSVRLVIVGTGSMGHQHAEQYAEIADVEIVGGVDTNPDKLAEFVEKHGISRAFSSVEEALSWGEFDAVANVTPDAVHKVSTLPFLEAGKHVFCEKPLAANYQDALVMCEAAKRNGVVNMVNLTYRSVPALMEAHRKIAHGDIGEVRHFQAAYLQSWLTQPAWGQWDKMDKWLWRLSTSHGSNGTLGDIGVHILDFMTFAAGLNATDVACRLTTFDKAPGGKIGEYLLDANDSVEMMLKLENGASGVVHATRMASGHHNDLSLRIYGTKGGVEVISTPESSSLKVCEGDNLVKGRWQEIESPAVDSNYVRFIEAVNTQQMVQPDFSCGARLQEVLDLAVLSNENDSSNKSIEKA